MTDLKPCPFCGSKNIHSEYDYDNLWDTTACQDCAVTAYGKTKEEASEAWNKRATDAKYERLLAFVKELADNFSFNQSEEDFVKIMVGFEARAHELLEEMHKHE